MLHLALADHIVLLQYLQGERFGGRRILHQFDAPEAADAQRANYVQLLQLQVRVGRIQLDGRPHGRLIVVGQFGVLQL